MQAFNFAVLKRFRQRPTAAAQISTTIFLLILSISLLLPDPAETAPTHKRKSYSLRKGSRLERHHRKSLAQWRLAYEHLGGGSAERHHRHHKEHHRHQRHHKKKPKIHRLHLDEILQKMDSVVKPRFGRK